MPPPTPYVAKRRRRQPKTPWGSRGACLFGGRPQATIGPCGPMEEGSRTPVEFKPPGAQDSKGCRANGKRPRIPGSFSTPSHRCGGGGRGRPPQTNPSMDASRCSPSRLRIAAQAPSGHPQHQGFRPPHATLGRSPLQNLIQSAHSEAPKAQAAFSRLTIQFTPNLSAHIPK